MTQSIAPNFKRPASTPSILDSHHNLALPSVKPSPVWTKAVSQVGVEFAPTPLAVTEGRIPAGLRGCLYRNGPARLERGSQRVGHWFDGDGAVLAVSFGKGGATGAYRFVRTEAYEADERAGRFTRGSYGTIAPSGGLPVSIRQSIKNPASVSVLALPDKTLALWDQGHPYALDPHTLETQGEDSLGALEDSDAFASHYKRDPITGEIFNFGVFYGLQPGIQVYRCDRTGRIRQKAKISLGGLPVVHDFLLTKNYLVFVVPPVRLDALSVLCHRKSFSDALDWKPQLGTEIIVVDRHSLKVISRSKTDPWYFWHVGNGYEDADGFVVGDLVRYDDFRTNEYLKQVGLLDIRTPALGTLHRLRINPSSAKVIEMECAFDLGGEFPTVAAANVTREHRYTYLSTYRPHRTDSLDLWSTFARFDYYTGEATVADVGDRRYCIEPLYAADALDPSRGWVLTVVYDGDRHASEVWVYDSDRIGDGPTCKLALPEVIPHGYHGVWSPARS